MLISDGQTKDSLQETMNVVFEHVGLPPSQVLDKAPKNQRDYPPMDKAVEHRLRDFYAPYDDCLLYTSPSPRDRQKSRMPSSA